MTGVQTCALPIFTNGGRVLCVTTMGHNVRTAQQRAYEVAANIRFDGMQMRHDIGHHAISVRKP